MAVTMEINANETYNIEVISIVSKRLPKKQSMWENVLHQSREKEKQKFGEQKAKTLKHFLKKGEDDSVGSRYHRRSISELIIEWELLQSQFAVASERFEAAIRSSKQKWSSINNNNLTINNECINFGETYVFDSSEFKVDSFDLVKDALHRNSSKPLALLCGLYGSDHKLISSPTDVIAVAILGDDGTPFLGMQINHRSGFENDTSMLGVKRAVCFVGRIVVMEKIINISDNRSSNDHANSQQDLLDVERICSETIDDILNKIEVRNSSLADSKCTVYEQDLYLIECVWEKDENENAIKDCSDVKDNYDKVVDDGEVNDDEDDNDDGEVNSVIIWDDEGIDKTWRSTSSSVEDSYDLTDMDDLLDQDMMSNDKFGTWVIVEEPSPTSTTTSLLTPPIPIALQELLDNVIVWWHTKIVR